MKHRIVVPNKEQLVSAAELYCQIWKEAPWNEDFWIPEEVVMDFRQIVEVQLGQVLVASFSQEVVGLVGGFPMSMADLHERSGSWFEEYLDPLDTVLYIAELATGTTGFVRPAARARDPDRTQ